MGTSLPQHDPRPSTVVTWGTIRREEFHAKDNEQSFAIPHDDRLSGRQRAELREPGPSVAGQSVVEAYPCFFHRDCGGRAEVEKQGKGVCRECAAHLKGNEYPLRKPCRGPLYPNVRELILQLEMKESGHRGFEP